MKGGSRLRRRFCEPFIVIGEAEKKVLPVSAVDRFGEASYFLRAVEPHLDHRRRNGRSFVKNGAFLASLGQVRQSVSEVFKIGQASVLAILKATIYGAT